MFTPYTPSPVTRGRCSRCLGYVTCSGGCTPCGTTTMQTVTTEIVVTELITVHVPDEWFPSLK